MQYEIVIRPSAEKNLDKLPRTVRRRIADALEKLRDNPRCPGAKKLAGSDDLWRIRVGEYRVVYEIHDDRLIVLVVRIGHRKDIDGGNGS